MIRRGFTLLELLVVIGIIAILSGLLVMGVTHMQTSGKRQQTVLLLENMRAMYADYDAAVHPHFPSYLDASMIAPGATTNVNMPCPMNVSADFFNSTSPAGQGLATLSSDRTGNAVLFTRDIVSLLRSTTTNSTSLGKLSASSIMRFQQTIVPAAYSAGAYTMLNRVSVPNTANPAIPPYFYYTCIQTCISTTPTPPNSSYWINSTIYNATPTLADNTVPVVLDAWGNPIIFVSGGALGTGQPLVANPSGSGPATVGVGTGSILVGGIGAFDSAAPPSSLPSTFIVKSPEGRPFFASAGPDGDFSKGDDNLYSFEK